MQGYVPIKIGHRRNKEIPTLLSIQKGNPLENKARNFKIFIHMVGCRIVKSKQITIVLKFEIHLKS